MGLLKKLANALCSVAVAIFELVELVFTTLT